MHGYLGPETQQELVRKMYVKEQSSRICQKIQSTMRKVEEGEGERKKEELQANKHDHHSKNLTLTLNTLSTHTQLPPDNGNAADSEQNQQNDDPANPRLASVQLPPEIIDYVDSARNPDIYTREFVELVQRGNQDLKGKREAFAGFRDVLAREMRSAMPECAGEVDRVVAVTGGTAGGGLNSSSNPNANANAN